MVVGVFLRLNFFWDFYRWVNFSFCKVVFGGFIVFCYLFSFEEMKLGWGGGRRFWRDGLGCLDNRIFVLEDVFFWRLVGAYFWF